MTSKSTILTGDRPTGPLHLGHYVGSLRARVELQDSHEQFVLIADAQAMTDNAVNPAKVTNNVIEVALDYLAVGIDPAKTTICVQSCLSALHEMTTIFLNHVTVSRLERNPTVKEEIRHRNFERDVPAGFLCYPAAQAADITAFKAELVPVGEDQLPMIEQTNEIVRRVNNLVGRPTLLEAKALVSKTGRLPGIDGKLKMSKSAGNAIALSATPDEISAAVKAMYTDPQHLRVTDPGNVKGNVVFAFLDAFDDDFEAIQDLKAHYARGGLGDSVLKRRLDEKLQAIIAPIRARRVELANDRSAIIDILRRGTDAAREKTQATLDDLKSGLGLFRF